MAQISRAALEPMPETADPLRFEELVSELSAGFVDAAGDEVEVAIRDAQRLVVETLDLDRSTLFQLDASGLDLTVTHAFGRPDVPGMSPAPIGLSARNSFPQLIERMRQGEPVVYGSHHDLAVPATDHAALLRLGPRSNIALPLSAGGRLMGALAFGTFTRERTWPTELVSRLGVIATVFAGALARKQGEQALRAAQAEVVRLKDLLSQQSHSLRSTARESVGTWR